MATVKVNGRSIDVDIREEIEIYDWHHAKWTEDKLIASSPFRHDTKPSFWVHLNGEMAGVFGDSAYEDDYFRSGQLPKLLSFLRNESYEETCEYLLDKYDYEYNDNDVILTTPILSVKQRKEPLSPLLYAKPLDNEYLIARGIHPRVVEMNGVFDNGDNIGIPWRDLSGNVAAIKYRHKRSKYFWYADGGTALSDLVFGLDTVIKRGISRIAICEAEIDAMTWQSAGIMAVAIGGARFNDKQADMLVQSGVTEVIMAGDNDVQGKKFNRIIYEKLNGIVSLSEIDYNYFNGVKDANELGRSRLRNVPIKPIERKIRV